MKNNVNEYKNDQSEMTSTFFTPFGSYVEEAYIPLGRQGLSYLFYSPVISDVVSLSPANLRSRMFLEATFGIEFVRQNFKMFDIAKGEKVEDIQVLSDRLAQECDSCDVMFDNSMVRGLGLYPTKTGFVLNLGRRGVFDENGYPLPRFHQGYFYSAHNSSWNLDVDSIANQSDFYTLTDAFSTFNFESPLEVDIVIGAVLAGMIGSALNIRPIVCFEAEAGSGKTLLLKCISTMLHKQTTARFSTPQNSAQILASIKNGSTGIVMDEFESKDYSTKTLSEVLGLFRSSFSADDDSGVVKATGGKKVAYRLSCPVFLGGINLPKFDEATSSRCIKIKLNQFYKRLDAENPSRDEVYSAIEEVSDKLRSFMISNFAFVRDTIGMVHNMMGEYEMSSRQCDKWSVVIAGAVAYKQCLHNNEFDPLGYIVELINHAFEYEVGANASGVEASTFETILLNIAVPIGGNTRQLGDLLSDLRNHSDQIDMPLLKRSLESVGLNIVFPGGSPMLAVAKSECFSVVSSAFKKAGISRDEWHFSAKEMFGVIADKVVKFGKKPHRAFVFPIDRLLSEPHELLDIMV